jgi:hypothetical protein
MAQNGVHELDGLREALSSSSTKWRIAELNGLQDQLKNRGWQEKCSIMEKTGG